jgi:hypothetical protein
MGLNCFDLVTRGLMRDESAKVLALHLLAPLAAVDLFESAKDPSICPLHDLAISPATETGEVFEDLIRIQAQLVSLNEHLAIPVRQGRHRLASHRDSLTAFDKFNRGFGRFIREGPDVSEWNSMEDPLVPPFVDHPVLA